MDQGKLGSICMLVEAITQEHSTFMKIYNLALDLLVSLFCYLVARGSRKHGNRQILMHKLSN